MDLDIFGDYDQKFISYACRWVGEEIAKCESEDDFTAFPHIITTRLKDHMVGLEDFTYITHCAAEASEEEKFIAAKHYEDHVIYACSLAWALFLRGIEEEMESESPLEESEELEKESPSVCVDE